MRFTKYTEKQKAEFRVKFRQTQRYQVAAFVPVGGAVLLLVAGERYTADFGVGQMWLGVGFLLAVAAGFSWLNWRCPACRKFLGKVVNPEDCPNCGLALRSR